MEWMLKESAKKKARKISRYKNNEVKLAITHP